MEEKEKTPRKPEEIPRYCVNCSKPFFKKSKYAFMNHICIDKLSDNVKQIIENPPISEKLNPVIKVRGVRISKNFTKTCKLEDLQDLIDYSISNFDNWFYFKNNEFLKKISSIPFGSGDYTSTVQNYFEAIVRTGNTYTFKWLKEVVKESIYNELQRNVILLKVENPVEFNKNITSSFIGTLFNDYEKELKLHHYESEESTGVTSIDAHPSKFATWKEKRKGMLDSKWKLNNSPQFVKDIVLKVSKDLKNCKCDEVFILLKTPGYFTPFHLDVTDQPSVAVLVQLVGQTTLFATTSVLGLHFTSKRLNGINSIKDHIEQLYGANNHFKNNFKRFVTLKQGDMAFILPGCLHEAHVPTTDNTKSALMVFNLKLDDMENKLEKMELIPFKEPRKRKEIATKKKVTPRKKRGRKRNT